MSELALDGRKSHQMSPLRHSPLSKCVLVPEKNIILSNGSTLRVNLNQCTKRTAVALDHIPLNLQPNAPGLPMGSAFLIEGTTNPFFGAAVLANDHTSFIEDVLNQSNNIVISPESHLTQSGPISSMSNEPLMNQHPDGDEKVTSIMANVSYTVKKRKKLENKGRRDACEINLSGSLPPKDPPNTSGIRVSSVPKAFRSRPEAYERVKQRAKERYYRNRDKVLTKAKQNYRDMVEASGKTVRGSNESTPPAASGARTDGSKDPHELAKAYVRKKSAVRQKYYDNREAMLKKARDRYQRKLASLDEIVQCLRNSHALSPSQTDLWKKNESYVANRLSPKFPKGKKATIKKPGNDCGAEAYRCQVPEVKVKTELKLQLGSDVQSPTLMSNFKDIGMTNWLHSHPEVNCITLLPMSEPLPPILETTSESPCPRVAVNSWANAPNLVKFES